MSGIKPSPEILAVARRWIDAIPNRRPKDLRNLLTKGDHLRLVGTGEGELWAGEAVRQGIGDFFGDIPEIATHVETFAEAFENGETGWACLVHDLSFVPQPEEIFNVRTTLIFALEDGAWKIVHRHGSVPLPNIDFVGTAQTAIADLVAAARQGFALNQRAGFASVMFTDIVNSSRLSSILGDRLWSSEMTRHFAALRDIIENHGGQFVKSLGDGTMSSFPTPAQSLQAAQSILRETTTSDGPDIGLRIGIHTGDVVQTEDDFFGTVVNKAARITANAAVNEIHVSDTTREMVADASDMRFANPVSVPLRGFDGDQLLYRLEWQE
ncbi:adenylate/guanylate cyclase domain-containing protein [Shimia sediminis]|uniref:adenylate/guanylate cyclase domain-containing protein n=1 Tax=Shimia sediminis TaxID=2497945 RepID=UPI000F8EB4A0|nr:adenylate/guanylate cyclase domain-containing protein [Shimia sediminis]